MMIQVKDKYYFITEKMLERPFKSNDKFYVRLKGTHEIQEITETDYFYLGGK